MSTTRFMWVQSVMPTEFWCYVQKEEGGGYSVIARDIPGACSQGETLEEAVANIIEATQGACEAYLESTGIPLYEEDVPAGALVMLIPMDWSGN